MFFFNPYFNPIIVAAAVIPAVALMIYVYRQDKLEREPLRLLLQLALMGALAAFLASLTEKAGLWILGRFTYSSEDTYLALVYFLVVAVSEEGFKYLLMKRKTWFSESFNCQYDGVVYAVFVALGFALVENVGYVVQYGFSAALVRAVTAVPGHACFGVFMGAWYGSAKRYDNYGYPERSTFFRVMSFLVPCLLHGIYDYVASHEGGGYTALFVGFIIVLFAVSFLLVRKLSREDRYID